MDGINNGGDDDVNKKLELLLKLSYDAAMLGLMASRYTDTYLNKQPRRIAVQTGYEWVMEKLSRRKSCLIGRAHV